ncbi:MULTISPECIES: glycoside hydrolase family 3 N-terminal domain-containing protein [Pseudonocardia]|uniref:beta-N-acetylhexosaminidase n=2 Tax=Pseudonocardia TaxID=1847 RepID=A0A1Y2MMQ9_PSEAH|nr:MULTISPECIES: glycoside hydrolase family 3 N-terminal domain-containing protein [Pseudonocardia]OSY36530.1 Beta-hexosaminidase A precursor [Pseudonocardia autotrophica]TDN76290.1 beta-N-acetylhexosaminidase [Pseudonocardia autotrophica]BBG00273.1 beta-glucosidase [Pseudonocardia autotrophica]GEC29111.1 beta-glucosidase [Pseudonocardia saturnea]
MRGRNHPVTGARRRRGAGLLTAAVAGALVAGTVTVVVGTPALTANRADDRAPAPQAAPASAEPVRQVVDTCAPAVAQLSPRDRLAQRLMVGVDASDPAGAATIVRDSKVGGVFLGGNGTALLQDGRMQALQDASPTPLAVAVDEEGGRVQRIDELDGDIPSARSMAASSTPDEVTGIARERAAQLRARGVTWNLAPTVDVSDQPRTSVIGDRAFSGDPETVTRYAQAWAQGQQAGGVFGVLKHFPGHGSSSGDSHEGSVSTPPLDQLQRSDLLPYEALVGPGKPLDGQVGVMLGHLDVPGLTTDVPTSVEPAAYRLLREQYRFDGVVMTDDLGAMKAITDRFGLAESTVLALSAGADIALFSNVTPVGPLLDAAERALADGRITPEANDAAVARVLESKGLCTRG